MPGRKCSPSRLGGKLFAKYDAVPGMAGLRLRLKPFSDRDRGHEEKPKFLFGGSNLTSATRTH